MKIKEEVLPNSVGGQAVPSITDPTTNYALQLKKKLGSKILRRKSVPMVSTSDCKKK